MSGREQPKLIDDTNQCDSVKYSVSSFISTAPRDSFPSFVGTTQYRHVTKKAHFWDAQGVIDMSCNNLDSNIPTSSQKRYWNP